MSVTLEEQLAASELAIEIAQRHGLTVGAMLSGDRHRANVQARAELYRSLRSRGWSYPEIAALANRNHATVLRHCNPDSAARKKLVAFRRAEAKGVA